MGEQPFRGLSSLPFLPTHLFTIELAEDILNVILPRYPVGLIDHGLERLKKLKPSSPYSQSPAWKPSAQEAPVSRELPEPAYLP